KVAINPDGDLSRCGADPRFLLGNLFDTPLLDIWNNSEILQSFRQCSYLPGRCQICERLQYCGGGCPLSCEKDKDHSTDYLLSEYLTLNDEVTGQLSFKVAEQKHISDMLKIEWANFSKYQHVFNIQNISEWYSHNPKMFYVVADENDDVFAYAVIVPMMKILYEKVRVGKFSTLIDFPKNEVLKDLDTDYFHLEVIATRPAKNYMPVSGVLIKGVGKILLDNAKFITTCPMTDKGSKLSRFFGFKKISEENYNGEIYPIAELKITSKAKERIRAF
ncbi:MAG: SPASM domain-containing protein, partial [Oscillospiraceae bacterium]|nr:SPASM domain-containing protein [Oscillospiraceae bacterium]